MESSQEALDAAATEYADVAVPQPFFAQVEEFRQRGERKSRAKLLDAWAKAQGLTASEPFQRLLNTAVFHKDMASFLQNLLLGQESDLMRSATGKLYEAGAVTLMTLHGSKGLEFPVVFLAGVRQGKIPLESPKHPANVEEERRLFYVGMTRAQDELILLTSNEPSCFLDAIPADCLHKTTTGGKKRASEMKQLSLFD
ncbi:MAG: 3'-5' exonuclease [Anaeromassilibacillus sp.]